jgi:hypothetical protein
LNLVGFGITGLILAGCGILAVGLVISLKKYRGQYNLMQVVSRSYSNENVLMGESSL